MGMWVEDPPHRGRGKKEGKVGRGIILETLINKIINKKEEERTARKCETEEICPEKDLSGVHEYLPKSYQSLLVQIAFDNHLMK